MNGLITLFVFVISLLLADGLWAKPLCASPDVSGQYAKNFKGLSEGKDDWLFRKHDLLNRFGPNRIGLEGLAELQRALKASGTQLVMLPVPTRGIVHPDKLGDIDFDVEQARNAYREYLDRLRQLDILVPELDRMFEAGQSAQLFFARDHHWTPAGAELAAASVADVIAPEEPGSDDYISFTSSVLSLKTVNPGSYSRAAAELCGRSYEPEVFSNFETTGELDLFADVPSPSIVLVGTSNSKAAMDYNFAGFLKASLNADVVNLAQSGGGYDGAIRDYLASDAFKNTPPKYLIWEVPGYYSLNTASFYQQVLASLGGES